jgi:hypothetical protein
MPSSLVNFVRDRLDGEMTLIRDRNTSLAQLLDCPVSVTLSESVRLRRGSDLQPGRGLEMVLRHGWSTPEEWGTWSIGTTSTLRVTFDRSITLPITVELELQAFVPSELTQSVAISVNGRGLAILEFGLSYAHRTQVIELHSGDLTPDFSAEIAFGIANPIAPADVSSSPDRRKLGVAIRRLRTR